MKRDGRKLNRTTQEEFRLLALRRVKEGEKPSEVVKSLGMNRTSIYRWLKAASGRGKGERALVARPATGRPPKLTAHQRAQVLRWINGKDPRQYGLDFGLWTRQIVATLIEQRFGVRMGVTAVGRLLARLGLTPQKPLQVTVSGTRLASSGRR
ncbi:IS630 family transposase ISAzo30 [Cupriavidus pinatubonensis]|uniref:IS630 family transposase ISAzo30 n=1 Tax=Cupriavidus pinatubonensis TaxID=248026 RepID=A0ABM8Y4A7_9BURK|nr:IS630 family transposase ISAzo30 [Cupriavidus pinatubonensis]